MEELIMRKTKLGLILAMCVLLLTMLLTGCGGTGSVDTAKVEKAVLSVMNEALKDRARCFAGSIENG